MIEKTVLQFLDEHLDEDVACERTGQTAPFVLLEKTGSGRVNLLNRSTFAMQSYGATMLRAIELNERVKEVAHNLTELDTVTSVRLVSDYNFTDSETKEYRYQAIFDIYHY